MASITYKQEEVEVKITNKVLMKFELGGNSMSDFETKPVSASITLACCCLGLDGDPLDHADDLPPLNELAEQIRVIMEESGLGEQTKKGK